MLADLVGELAEVRDLPLDNAALQAALNTVALSPEPTPLMQRRFKLP